LAKQYKIEYAPLKGGATETYFRRMAEIEEQFYKLICSLYSYILIYFQYLEANVFKRIIGFT